MARLDRPIDRLRITANRVMMVVGSSTRILGASFPQPVLAGSSMSGDEFQACPACGEQIRARARKCRFCGEILDEEEADPYERRTVRRSGRGRSRAAEDPNDKSNATVILVTGILGCFSPIVLIYGIIFLLKRSYDFDGKTMAIIGTILHGIWTLLIIGSLALHAVAPQGQGF